ncbi:MAG: cupin domain-containing protein [Deltaproteobacteria bacterium]|nr:cupin domain-containing protein [Deltaproteobacteria bacterium]
MGGRVFLFDKMEEVIREFPQNKSKIWARNVIERGKPLSAESAFWASGVNRIDPGEAIPWHEHAEDEEVYFIISGEGVYLDNEKKAHKVKAGDVTFCLKGEKHGLENPGPASLLFGAAIVKK